VTNVPFSMDRVTTVLQPKLSWECHWMFWLRPSSSHGGGFIAHATSYCGSEALLKFIHSHRHHHQVLRFSLARRTVLQTVDCHRRPSLRFSLVKLVVSSDWHIHLCYQTVVVQTESEDILDCASVTLLFSINLLHYEERTEHIRVDHSAAVRL